MEPNIKERKIHRKINYQCHKLLLKLLSLTRKWIKNGIVKCNNDWNEFIKQDNVRTILLDICSIPKDILDNYIWTNNYCREIDGICVSISIIEEIYLPIRPYLEFNCYIWNDNYDSYGNNCCINNYYSEIKIEFTGLCDVYNRYNSKEEEKQEIKRKKLLKLKERKEMKLELLQYLNLDIEEWSGWEDNFGLEKLFKESGPDQHMCNTFYFGFSGIPEIVKLTTQENIKNFVIKLFEVYEEYVENSITKDFFAENLKILLQIPDKDINSFIHVIDNHKSSITMDDSHIYIDNNYAICIFADSIENVKKERIKQNRLQLDLKFNI